MRYSVFGRFNSPKEKKIEQQQKLLAALEKAWSESPLLSEMRSCVERIAAFR